MYGLDSFDTPTGVLDERRRDVARLGGDRLDLEKSDTGPSRDVRAGDDVVDEAVLEGFLSGEPAVAVESASIRSMGWPVNSALSRNISFLMSANCSAWIAMSAGAAGDTTEWLVHQDAGVRQSVALPLAPAASRNSPIEAAIPIAWRHVARVSTMVS